MLKRFLFSIVTAAIITSQVFAEEPGDTAVKLSYPITSTLTDARCVEVKTGSTSEITCFLSFPDSVPDYFYEVDTTSSQIVIKLINTNIGEMIVSGKTDTVNLGPVTTMLTRGEIQNKNEAMKGLTPELYSVVLVTLSLKPMIRHQKDVVISDMDNAITISLPWPEVQKEREKKYVFVKKPRRTKLMASLIGIGTVGFAAGGYLAYKRFSNDSEDKLNPVLPSHPDEP